MYTYKAECIKVVDGDTFDLEVDLGFNIKITERFRLARVNTPEVRGVEREEGLRVKEFVNTKLKDILSVTTAKNKGKYGRWIAEVCYKEGDLWYNISDVLLKEGMAKEVNYD